MRTVVILDNNPTTRKLIMMTLGDEKYRYVEAGDANSGINLILSELPALVIVSQELKYRSGMDVARTIKRIHGLANIPFILLFDDPKPKDSAISDAGIDGAVPRKLLTRFLKDEVNKVLNHPQASHLTDWLGAEKPLTEMDEERVYSRAATRTSPNLSHDSAAPPHFHRRTDAIKLPDEVLAETSRAAEPKTQQRIKTEPYYPQDFAKNAGASGSAYNDPVDAFMKDEISNIIYHHKKESSTAHAVEHKLPSRESGIGARESPLKTRVSTNSQTRMPSPEPHSGLSDAQITVAVREAVLEVIKEIVPTFKEKLVTALEKKLKVK